MENIMGVDGYKIFETNEVIFEDGVYKAEVIKQFSFSDNGKWSKPVGLKMVEESSDITKLIANVEKYRPKFEEQFKNFVSDFFEPVEE